MRFNMKSDGMVGGWRLFEFPALFPLLHIHVFSMELEGIGRPRVGQVRRYRARQWMEQDSQTISTERFKD